ncbi:hypothetical protein HZH68_001622 [Vespula germanica]|uniref:Uncharacterized protein n=1 Tax=Vespula germanica TaxID=30212 RepID=A0A834U6W7_VESGE|nr:hypothetical protein HZH68_001622 [Vespula germanica]
MIRKRIPNDHFVNVTRYQMMSNKSSVFREDVIGSSSGSKLVEAVSDRRGVKAPSVPIIPWLPMWEP